MLKRLLTIVSALLLAACAAVPLPKDLPPPGGIVDTLQGSVNISLATSAGQTSGNGVFIYRRPDSFRLAILAPFGQRILDIIVNDGKVLCIAESKKKAWQGGIGDLPEWLGMRVWPLLRWVVEPSPTAGPARERTFTRADGTRETIYYDAAGFSIRKVNASGDEVSYSDYRPANGVAVPQVISIKTVEGSTLTLTFDEPDVNLPVEDEVLYPRVDHYEILPLAEFKGF